MKTLEELATIYDGWAMLNESLADRMTGTLMHSEDEGHQRALERASALRGEAQELRERARRLRG